ncbi:MAG: thioredoxin domain-containing protein [Betaproteobacteria bacterium]|nr:thioredoxin domain-containing protein [Betaproteobacteria bacterium]
MANKLSQSTSPYLLQHAHNPVHWREWDAEALAEARATGKPILLSIGYSACHWCHVMAHESFEDEGIAAIMNAHFVNIKVDREERPDLDQIYQTAHALLTQRNGGWPLTMFLTADTTPFFGGTYFPKTARYGLPGFGDLLTRVAQYHREQPDEIRAQNGRLQQALAAQHAVAPPAGALDRAPLEQGWREMHASFDPHWGGFGQAPKFPHPEMIEFCLRRAALQHDDEARHVACHTLEMMCRGGLFDQVGGGFARYSVDAEWAIPHFEKMLYDNGPLLRLLGDAHRITRDGRQQALFRRCAVATAEWGLREMQSPAGGFYSTIDADSEGHEGKFYVWQKDEVRALLKPAEWDLAAPYWGLDRAPNFEGEAWHLIATSLDHAEDAGIGSARAKLFAAREARIRPGRDDKILVSWNALMIEGLARAAIAFERPDWLAAARRSLTFIRASMWDAPNRRLFATHKDGVSRLNAYLDDYAFLLKAILAVAEADFDAGEFAFACALAEVLLERFEDPEAGGFHFTSHDHEQLIDRTKPSFDNATPSGNGVAAIALQRLAHWTGDARWIESAEAALHAFSGALRARPAGHGSLLMALEEHFAPPRMLILTGPEGDIEAWRRALAAPYRPDLMVVTPGRGASVPEPLRRPVGERVNAYLCQGVACLPAIADLTQLQAALNAPIVLPG